MRYTMTLAAAAALATIVASGPAWAQQADTGQFATGVNQGQTMNLVEPQPVFRFFGLPVGIGAPVAPPYANSAYRNYAGQPATGYAHLAMAGGLTN